jgi:hypothetical protein
MNYTEEPVHTLDGADVRKAIERTARRGVPRKQIHRYPAAMRDVDDRVFSIMTIDGMDNLAPGPALRFQE